MVEDVGGESGGLERRNHNPTTVAPKLPGPPCGFLSKVWKVPGAIRVENCTEISDGVGLVFRRDSKQWYRLGDIESVLEGLAILGNTA